MNGSNVVEIPSFFQNKTAKRLIFSKEGIKIEKPNSFEAPVFIAAVNIEAFRYGVVWVSGFRFTVGRKYSIELKDTNNNIFKIKLKSYYGIRRESYANAYSEIIAGLWGNYFGPMCDERLQVYKSLEPFDFAAVKFLYDGISWDRKNKLLWEEIALSNYKTYFTIHHAEHAKQHKSFNFAVDWNALVLQQLMKQIVALNKKAK